MQLNAAALLCQQRKEKRKATLLARTPSWLDRETCALTERKDGVNINLWYYCPGCSPDKLCKTHTIYIKQMQELPIEDIQDIVAEKVQSKHGAHNQSEQASEEPLTSTKRLQNTAVAAKRKVSKMQSQVATAELQVKKAKSAVQAQEQQKRLQSTAAGRRANDITSG